MPRSRVVAPVTIGALAAAATLLGLALRIGLLSVPGLGGGLIGVGDNGDGYRLFCTAGLVPLTPDGGALWRGVVVTSFATGATPCVAAPSSPAVLLGLVVPSGPGTFSLTTLAWLFAGLVAAGVGLAVAALASVRPRRALLVVLPLVPLLAVPWWSRFLVSTYAEPAALVAAVWAVAALLVVAGTRPTDRWQRAVALGLLGLAGLLAATAKPGFLPLGLVVAACAATVVLRSPADDGAGPPGRATRASRASRASRIAHRAAGPLVAAALLAALAAPVAASLEGQERAYAAINAHNLIFTALLPTLGPERTLPAVGLPPEAGARAGEGYYVAGAAGIPGWPEAVGARPTEARDAARALLARNPGALATMVGDGLTATMRPQLDYLPAAPRGTAPERYEGRTFYPEAGPTTALLRVWLDGIALGWLPGAIVATALVVGAATGLPRVRRSDPLVVGLARAAAATALAGLGIVVLAVVGDGYYELSKHVWLAGYLILTTALLVVTAGCAATTARYRRRSRITRSDPEDLRLRPFVSRDANFSTPLRRF